VFAIYAWLRRHPQLVDGLLALVIAGLGTGTMAGDLARRGPLTLFLVVPVVFRRRAPVLAFAVAAAAGAAQVIVTRAGPSAADLAIVVLLYTLAAYRPRRESVAGLFVCLLGCGVAVLAWAPVRLPLLERLFVGAVMFGGTALVAWVLGDSMRYRRAYYAALEERAARLEAERDAQAKISAAAERARIARELHDVIAHNVSVMVVQADGASYALRSEPERARQALAAISGTGRQALAEMRRLLGVLRAGDSGADLAPQPGLEQVRELLDQARAAGLSVSLTMQGTPQPLSEGTELAAYRVVQESLTNTRKHGGALAAAAVTLRYEPDGLVVQVTDDGGGETAPGEGTNGRRTPAHAEVTGPGLGLTGMRERIEMYGGSVNAGPLPTGGYQVVARLPAAELGSPV
jgi:signal transduction histidine kinase